MVALLVQKLRKTNVWDESGLSFILCVCALFTLLVVGVSSEEATWVCASAQPRDKLQLIKFLREAHRLKQFFSFGGHTLGMREQQAVSKGN